MTRFLLVRHATTPANGKRLVGRLPGIALDEAGMADAAALAARLATHAIDAVYSSPMARAIQTATPIATLRALDVVVREEFDEMDFGEWTGRTFDALARDPRFHRFNAFRGGTPAPGGESMPDVQARMVRGLLALRDRHPGGCVVVASHCDPLRAAIAHVLGLHLDMLLRFDVAPASLSVVEIGEDYARLLALNDTAHLSRPAH